MAYASSFMPLPRLFVPFGMGAVGYLQFGEPGFVFPGIWVAGAMAFAGFIVCLVNRSVPGSDLLGGLCMALLLLQAGYLLARQQNQFSRSTHFRHYHQEEGYLLVQITEPLSERANSYQAITDVLYIGNDSIRHAAEGRLMIYFEKDSLVPGLSYGDRLLVRGRVSEVSPPVNPEVFNYKEYLARQNIFHTMYIRSGEWVKAGSNHGRSYMRLALKLRQRALESFADNHLSGRDFAVISALLLGYREYLDEDLRREFAGAGAMHILCVSGLHVGIIFMVLNKLFGFLKRFRGGNFLKTGFIILFIWLYAAITGFSPSVLRASVMFSFVSLGQSFQRPTNIYNTLAASAFVLVASNPAIIKHIGFQLSYLAVISIVALQPWFENLLQIKNKWLSKAWAIVTVSLAAQLATGPLALHYFNQFPNYFILTNLAVIPLASVVIYTALASLALSPVPWVGSLSGQILSVIVSILHQTVGFIEGLPYSTSSGIYISFAETMLVFLFVLLLFIYLVKQRRSFFLMALGVFLSLTLSCSIRTLKNGLQRYFVVYHAGRATAVDFTTARKTVFLASDDMIGNDRQKAFSVKGLRLKRGSLYERAQVPVHDSLPAKSLDGFQRAGDLISFHGLTVKLIHEGSSIIKILQARRSAPHWPVHDTSPFAVDYLLVTGNVRFDAKELLCNFQPGKVILDGSNTPWRAADMEETFREKGVRVWNTHEKGAYVRELP